jgi:hypothetical protein
VKLRFLVECMYYHGLPVTQSVYGVTVQYVSHLQTTVSQLKMCDFSEKSFKCFEVLYNFLRVQRHTTALQARVLKNCVMKLYLLKVHPQTFLSLPITQKCQNF